MEEKLAGKHSEQGFTLVELLLVVAIIGVLASLAIPMFQGARERAERVTCMANQRVIKSQYLADYLLTDDPAAAITQALSELGYEAPQGTNPYTVADNDNGPCPTDGTYTITLGDNGQITIACSIAAHNSSGASGGGGTGSSTGSTTSGSTTSGSTTSSSTTSGSTTTGGVPAAIQNALGDWNSLVATAKNGNGSSIYSGTVYSDGSGNYYAVTWDNYLSKSDASTDITLAEYAAKYPSKMTKLDFANTLTADSLNSNDTWKTPPAYGAVYLYNGVYYAFMNQTSSIWTVSNPTQGGGWVELSQS